MNPSIASLICACGVVGLFYLNRDRSVRTSRALWLPVIYLWIIGSRPVSSWLGIAPPASANVQLEGSPFDAVLFGALSLGAIVVLVQRAKWARPILTANWPILVYFLYCLISVAWSFHPDVAFKRWIKAVGDPAMCLVIVTDPRPVEALKRVVSRVGFVLLPTSLLFIKYYGDLGRGYTADGLPMNTGVATNKNVLGLMLFTVSLYTLWQIMILLRAKGRPNRSRHLFAQGALLALGVLLLKMADSKTSIACFSLGAGLMFASGLRAIRSRPARVHMLCLTIFLAGGLILLLGGGSDVAHVMGRSSSLSGRTDIWAALIAAEHNPITGAGFESYWISPGVQAFQHTLLMEGWWHPETLNEAHDGYLEVYLNLGAVGVGLISWVLISGYGHAVAAFRKSPFLSAPMFAYIVCTAFYCITEAGFRSLDIVWIFLLLAIFSASGVMMGTFEGRTLRSSISRHSRANKTQDLAELIPKGRGAYAAPRGVSQVEVARGGNVS